MDRRFDYTVSPADAAKTPAEYLHGRGFSRKILTHLKKQTDAVLVNGAPVRAGARLATGDAVSVLLKEIPDPEKIQAVPLSFPVVYEDEDLLVVNKPWDMPVHPSANNYENTLANAAAWYFRREKSPFVYRCINRLDRDTTGLLILAKNLLSCSILSKMGAARQIHRDYLAIAAGEVPLAGMIDAPIGRREGSVLERTVSITSGEPAVTEFRRLTYADGFSLVLLSPQTGRTHQLRVHMKHIGHPLPGDFLYNPDFSKIKRQALHSCHLKFTHPINGQPMEFTAPIPEDFRAFACADERTTQCLDLEH